MNVERTIVVGGPGGTAFTADDTRSIAKGLATRLENTQAIVSGDKSLVGQEPVKDGFLLALAKSPVERTLLFVQAHGDYEEGVFCIQLDMGVWLPVAELFQAITECHEGPVEIFLTSCYGAGALKHAHLLPRGSVLVVLSPAEETTAGAQVDCLSDHLPMLAGVNAFGLLLAYCAVTGGGGIPPAVVADDGQVVLLDDALQCRRGRVLSDMEKALLHEQLDGYVGWERVNEVAAQVEGHGFIDARDRGMAMAIAAVLSGVTTLVQEPATTARCAPASAALTNVRMRMNTFEVARMFSEAPGSSFRLSLEVRGRWNSVGNTVVLRVEDENVTIVFTGEPWNGTLAIVSLEGSKNALDSLEKQGFLEQARGDKPLPPAAATCVGVRLDTSHSWVAAMYTERGGTVQLSEQLKGTWSGISDTLCLRDGHEEVNVVLKRLPNSDVVHVLTVDGSKAAMKKLQAMGIFTGKPLPTPVAVSSGVARESQIAQVPAIAVASPGMPNTPTIGGPERVIHPRIDEMFKCRGGKPLDLSKDGSKRIQGYWSQVSNALYLRVGGEDVVLRLAGEPVDGSVVVVKAEGSSRAINTLREHGVLVGTPVDPL